VKPGEADNITVDTIVADSSESGDFIIRPPGYAYTVGSTTYRKIPILPNEFMPNDDSSYYNLGIENDTNPYGWVRCMTGSLEMMAHISRVF
jgi:hypothetical protein